MAVVQDSEIMQKQWLKYQKDYETAKMVLICRNVIDSVLNKMELREYNNNEI